MPAGRWTRFWGMIRHARTGSGTLAHVPAPTDEQPFAALPTGTRIVVGAFAVSGVVHFVRPQVFEPLVPQALGQPRGWIYASGAVELVCAAGLVGRQRWAPLASAGTLAVIWIGNVHMARRWQRSSRRPAWAKALVWARVPLQVPLIVWALRSPVAREVGAAAAPVPQ